MSNTKNISYVNVTKTHQVNVTTTKKESYISLNGDMVELYTDNKKVEDFVCKVNNGSVDVNAPYKIGGTLRVLISDFLESQKEDDKRIFVAFDGTMWDKSKGNSKHWLHFSKKEGKITIVAIDKEDKKIDLASYEDKALLSAENVTLSPELSAILEDIFINRVTSNNNKRHLEGVGVSLDIIMSEKKKIEKYEAEILSDFLFAYDRAVELGKYSDNLVRTLLSNLYTSIESFECSTRSKTILANKVETLQIAFNDLKLAGRVNRAFIDTKTITFFVQYHNYISSNNIKKLAKIGLLPDYTELLKKVQFNAKFLEQLTLYYSDTKKYKTLEGVTNPLKYDEHGNVIFNSIDIQAVFKVFMDTKNLNTEPIQVSL